MTRERTCRSGDVRDLRWHTLIVEGQERVDMRYVCPEDAKKMLLGQAKSTYLRRWTAKHEDGSSQLWLEPALALLRKKERTEQHRNVARKLVLEGGWVQSAKHVTKRNAQKGTPLVPSMERGQT